MSQAKQDGLGPGTRVTSLGSFGLEVSGIDLEEFAFGAEETPGQFSSLRECIVAEGFVVFRGQNLKPESQIALGRRFGELESLRVEGDEGDEGDGTDPSLIVIGNVNEAGETFDDDDPRMKLMSINEGWHTDSSFRDQPASFSVFSAVTLPPSGGDTFFASLHCGWDALAPDEQTSLYGRIGIHDYDAAYRLRGNTSGNVVGFDMPAVEHPLVRVHPETGRIGLYVSEHVAGIVGMDAEAALPLLDHLIAVTTREGRVYRHAWAPGDVAIWDNRSMLHRAEGFDARFPRVMHHVRVSGGEKPIAAMRPKSA